MKRRTFLSVVSGAGFVTTAGCLDRWDDSYATVQRLYLVNILDEPATMELRIERDDTDEMVHENSYELPSGFDGIVVDCVWPDNPLRVLTRRADGSEWNTYTATDDEGCVALLAEANEHGTAYFGYAKDCPIRSPTCHENAGQ